MSNAQVSPRNEELANSLRSLAGSYRIDLKSPSTASMLDDAANALLSVSPPAEVEWGTARRDKDGNLFDEWVNESYETALADIERDGVDEESSLVLVKRAKAVPAGPWLPVSPESEGKK